MEKEKWVFIPNYEGLYQSSTFGNIKSVDKWVNGRYGNKVLRKGRILKPNKSSRYLLVSLYKDKKPKTWLVHVLVATTFHKKPSYPVEVLHKNNIKHDNHYLNLRWGTHKENIADSIRDGLVNRVPFGWERPSCKYPKNMYIKIFRLYNTGKYNKEQISRMVGRNSASIHKWVKTYNKHKDLIDKLLSI